MRILIIGDSSLIAKCVKERLEHKHSLVTAGRNNNADVYIDLAIVDSKLTTDIGNFDIIIHCAASFGGNLITDAVQNEIVNSIGSLQIGLLAKATECRHVIYLSSISSYDVPENEYFGSYGLSKKHGQDNLALLCNHFNIGFTALLPSQLYDAKSAARKHQPLFYHIIDSAKEGRDINFYGTQDPQRNYLFVEDLAVIIEKVIEHQSFGIFTCTHPRSYSLKETAEVAYKVFGKGGKVSFLTEKPNIPTVYIPEDNQLYTLIDYSPTTNLETGIMRIAEAMSSCRKI